jgi:type I restriction enzyme S subunit
MGMNNKNIPSNCDNAPNVETLHATSNHQTIDANVETLHATSLPNETKPLQPYTKYKPSSIAWLGEIPEHWEVESFKNILTERNEKNNPIRTKEILSLSIDKGVTLYAEKTTNLDRFKDDYTQYKLAHKDDLVFNSMNMIVGAVGVSNYFGCVSPIYYTYHGGYNQPNSTKFYEYLFRNKIVQSFLYSLGKGLMAIDRGDGKYNTLRLKISRDDLRSLKLPFPNFVEQTNIAAFLDHKTAKIDRFIRKKKQLIKLLNEQKTAIINDAVTGKITIAPTNVVVETLHATSLQQTQTFPQTEQPKTKPSGIEWLGDIPAHWEVRKLKYVINDKLKYGANEPGGDLQPNDPRYIRITDFDKSGILRNDTFCSLKSELAKPYLLKEGDILFARSGGTVGKTFQFKNYDGVACYAGYLIKAEPNINVMLSDFLFQFTNSGIYEIWKNFIFNKATIENIGADKYCNLPVIIPPLSEQTAIVSHIEKETAIINKTIATIEKEIALVQEYRTALIAEAVTGKIDVRDVIVPTAVETLHATSHATFHATSLPIDDFDDDETNIDDIFNAETE